MSHQDAASDGRTSPDDNPPTKARSPVDVIDKSSTHGSKHSRSRATSHGPDQHQDSHSEVSKTYSNLVFASNRRRVVHSQYKRRSSVEIRVVNRRSLRLMSAPSLGSMSTSEAVLECLTFKPRSHGCFEAIHFATNERLEMGVSALFCPCGDEKWHN